MISCNFFMANFSFQPMVKTEFSSTHKKIGKKRFTSALPSDAMPICASSGPKIRNKDSCILILAIFLLY